MRLIIRDDIEHWGETPEAKSQLPIVLSRLIWATTPVSTVVDFPAGKSVYLSGWDGSVQCKEDRAYVPNGHSLWELSTRKDVEGKVEEDYLKRKLKPQVPNPGDCTVIFVTTHFWKGKDDWAAEKRTEGFWKDVRVYDSETLEQWFDTCLSSARGFADYLGKVTIMGSQTPDEFWQEWSKGKLVPEVVTAGRDIESIGLLEFLSGAPAVMGIQASTKTEAIAFIIASAKLFDQQESGRFFAKTLIVTTEQEFRALRLKSKNFPLLFIPTFEDFQPLDAANLDGHHVIVPLGPEDALGGHVITLPTVARDGQIAALIRSGVPRGESERLSRESGRNVTILKKLLKFNLHKAEWVRNEEVRHIIPALLLGRWNEHLPGDRDLLAYLSGEPYETYEQKLAYWKGLSESPIMQIGESWRLVSPLDAWTSISSFLVSSDFDKLRNCFERAFKDGNPISSLADRRSGRISPEGTYSAWSRDGLVQSLILIGLHGEKLKMRTPVEPQRWVNGIVRTLLYKADGWLWVSLNHELPLIAEAAPASFLKAVQSSLSDAGTPVMEMFKESPDLIGSSSQHTGLLWALEGLAWLPEYLPDATLILARLTALDPGGTISNRPMNSLIEIFKCWRHGTLATYEERMSVLDLVIKKEKEIAWRLLCSMLPDPQGGAAFPTHTLRWRLFDQKNTHIEYTWEEMEKVRSFAVQRLMAMYDFSDEKTAELIRYSSQLSSENREALLSLFASSADRVKESGDSSWQALREILSTHRSVNAEWVMSEMALAPYQELYEKLQPEDELRKVMWLFNEDWVQLPEGGEFENGYDEIILEKKLEALTGILTKYGLERIIAMRKEVKNTFALGDTLARMDLNEDQTLRLAELFKVQDEDPTFVRTLFSTKSLFNDLNWVTSTFVKLEQAGFREKDLGQFLVPIKQSKEFWSFVEGTSAAVQDEYWRHVIPRLFDRSSEEKNYALGKLLRYHRRADSIGLGAHHASELSSTMICDMLLGVVTQDQGKVSVHEIERLFLEIDKRSDIETNILISLEWKYLSILASYGSRRKPRLLHRELADNPEFFTEALKAAFLPKNREILQEAPEGLDNEQRAAMSRQAGRLLYSWKDIPGMREDGSIEKDVLNKWVDSARILAAKTDRLEVGDAMIGNVLASYPERDTNWPPEEICELIERINSERMNNNFGAGITNNHGSTTRGPFDGGQIERDLAEYFQKHAASHRMKHPVISRILTEIAEDYLSRAKRMDEEAQRERLDY